MGMNLNPHGGKAELVLFYRTNKSSSAALWTPREYSRHTPGHMGDHCAARNHPNTHAFAPAQMAIIYRHLGIP